MLLGHLTNPTVTNIYKILQDGYLRPGTKTGVVRMWGWNNPSKYIYLTISHFNAIFSNFELDSNLLLENISWLNTYWNGEPNKNSIKVDGSKIDKKQLQKILKKYRNDIKSRYRGGENDDTLHEILLENDIDLVKYLRKLKLSRSFTGKKTYYKLLTLMKTKYPNVEINFKRYRE